MQRSHVVSSISETDCERQPIAASQAIKPLPPLPRGWSRVCHETGLFLRGIGLGIVVTAFQGSFTKNFLEPEKVAVRRSRITALLRTLIHAVPVGVAIFEIAFNFKGHFVGSNFDKQNYLQFAAKAHEITMQASLATILLSYIRYQISAGSGMPFGAVLSGLQFLQVSYLWSVELWSSLLSKDFQLRKKFCFAVLILICITVAATAGPSSASLLIARQGLWPTAPTYLAVNASVMDFWPDRLDDKYIRDCEMIGYAFSNGTADCSILDLYHLLDTGPNLLLTSLALGNTELLGLLSPEGTFLRFLTSSICSFSSQDQLCATIPQKELMNGYYSIQSSYANKYDFQSYQSLDKNYYQPYTVASCVADVVKDASDQTLLRFARISESESELEIDREIVPVPGLTKGNFVKSVPDDDSYFLINWVDLPKDVFNTGVPGAVIVNSQDTNGSFYTITTCTLNAGWGSSTVVSSSGESNSIFSAISNTPSSWPVDRQAYDPYGFLIVTVPNFANTSNFSYPQRRVSISTSWMESLNPTVVLADNSTGKFFNQLLSSVSPTEENFAHLLSLMLACAMSDSGKGRNWEVFSSLKNATRTCDNCLVFEVKNSLHGWFYSAGGTTTRLAITVMLIYCALVFGHIFYSAISGISSTAWDSAAELVALAMNSSPTEILQNTCAGIIGRKALKTPVRVLATNKGHLELVFGEPKDPNAPNSKLVMNEKYGRLAGDIDEEHEEPDYTV